MIPKQAIEKAIEGGWAYPGSLDAMTVYVNVVWQKIALDKTFWQALGKSCEWPEYDPVYSIEEHNASWVARAHEFLHLILTGGDTQKFWADLLT